MEIVPMYSAIGTAADAIVIAETVVIAEIAEARDFSSPSLLLCFSDYCPCSLISNRVDDYYTNRASHIMTILLYCA